VEENRTKILEGSAREGTHGIASGFGAIHWPCCKGYYSWRPFYL